MSDDGIDQEREIALQKWMYSQNKSKAEIDAFCFGWERAMDLAAELLRMADTGRTQEQKKWTN
jgi:hypothetical protein